jgi:hypothetical protein
MNVYLSPLPPLDPLYTPSKHNELQKSTSKTEYRPPFIANSKLPAAFRGWDDVAKGDGRRVQSGRKEMLKGQKIKRSFSKIKI